MDTAERAQVGANMQRLRKVKTWTQGEMASRMFHPSNTGRVERGRWTQSMVSRAESGAVDFTFDDLRILVKILGPEVLAGTTVQEQMQEAQTGLALDTFYATLLRLEASATYILETIEDLKKSMPNRVIVRGGSESERDG